MLKRYFLPIVLLGSLLLPVTASADTPPMFLFDVFLGFDRVQQIVQRSDGRVYIADAYHHRIVVCNENGAYLEQIGSFGTGLGQFDVASGLAFDRDGNLYVAEQHGNRIHVLSSTHLPLRTFGEGILSGPTNLAFGPDGTTLYVTEFLGDQISKFDRDGTLLGSWGSTGAGAGQLDHPYGIVVNDLGIVYVADEFNNRVQYFNSSGAYMGQWGGVGSAPGKFRFPVGLGIDLAGNIYATDQLNNRIQKFTFEGTPLVQWGTFGPGPNQFYNPWAVAPLRSGRIWIGDTYNHRVSVYGDLPVPASTLTWGSLKARYR